VEKIILRNKKAIGVKLVSGDIFLSNAIISNIDPIHTFFNLLSKDSLPSKYLRNLKKMRHSISAFTVHLGLNCDLNKQLSLGSEYEVFLNPSYNFDKDYLACLNNNMRDTPLAVTFYSNIDKRLAPPQKSYLSITALSGYDFWAKYLKKDYKDCKESFSNILIKRAQKLIPGLASHIAVKDIATPLTMERYTGNYKGAVFGWEQNVAQSGINRTDNFTPISNVYLAGAWTRPGAGLVGVLQSGERVAEHIIRMKK
jgi:prolycopene isomerase